MHYDKDGTPLELMEWAEKHADREYIRVARALITDLAPPFKQYDVSTVWLGLDHSFGNGPPLIFETMVFGDGSLDLTCHRYATEDEARQGHAEMVTLVRATMTDPIVGDAATPVHVENPPTQTGGEGTGSRGAGLADS